MIKFISLVIATLATANAVTAASSSDWSRQDRIFGEFGSLWDHDQEADSRVDLGTILASADGVVEIYDYRLGRPGALLGSEAVDAGYNHDSRVLLGIDRSDDVIAVLKIGGRVVDQRVFRFVEED